MLKNHYVGWKLEDLRAARLKIQEQLAWGYITRQSSAPGVFTEFSRDGEPSLEVCLERITYAIAQLEGATEEEIAAAASLNRVMKVCHSY